MSRITLRNFPLWTIPLSIAILFFPIKGVETSPDASWYLSNGLNIYNGKGYVDSGATPIFSRGPVFPALIATSFWLFGVSVRSGFYVVRLFYVLNVMLVYLIGKRFYGKWVGLVSSFLVLTSFEINLWSTQMLLDNVAPFFMLLYIFSVYSAFEKQGILWFIFAGVVLATACLTKEFAIVLFPLPVLVFAFGKSYRNRFNLGGIIILAVAFIGCMLPWLIHVHRIAGAYSSFLMPRLQYFWAIYAHFVEPSYGSNGLFIIRKNAQWIINAYRKQIAGTYLLAPFMIVIWLFTGTRAVAKNSKADLVLLCTGVLFLPVLIFLGMQEHWRIGHATIIYYITYIVLANFLWVVGWQVTGGIARIFTKGEGAHAHLTRCLMVMVFASVIFCQAIADKRMFKLLRGEKAGGLVAYGMSYFRTKDFEVGKWHAPYVKEAGAWIEAHIPRTSRILCEWHLKSALYFYTEGKYKFCGIEYFAVGLWPGEYKGGLKKGKLLFLWPFENRFGSEGNFMMALSEDCLLSQVENMDYAVVTYENNFLSLYFDANPGFEKLACFGDGKIKIYKVRTTKTCPGFEMRIGSATEEYFREMEETRPEKVEYLKNIVFKQYFGLSEQEIDKIVHGRYPTVEQYKIY